MASSMTLWWRLLRRKERTTIAAEIPRRRTRVARNVYRYNELELGTDVEVSAGGAACVD